jgi:hypothetical protein
MPIDNLALDAIAFLAVTGSAHDTPSSLLMRSRTTPMTPLGLPLGSRQSALPIAEMSAPCWKANDRMIAASLASTSTADATLWFVMKRLGDPAVAEPTIGAGKAQASVLEVEADRAAAIRQALARGHGGGSWLAPPAPLIGQRRFGNVESELRLQPNTRDAFQAAEGDGFYIAACGGVVGRVPR